MTALKPQRRANRSAGFSLMELAVVLMIIGTLMSGVLVAVSQTAENNRITNARAQLREIEEALYGYAQAYGRLPCPATDTSAPYEDRDAFTDVCSSSHGFVPSGTLGIYGSTNADDLLLDPWQQPLRYSLITTAGANNPDFSSKTSIQSFFNNGTTISNLSDVELFRVCEDDLCAAELSDIVPAVVMSLGKNWSEYTSADETLNAGDQTMGGYAIKDDYDFVATNYSEDNFDDQLVWLSPYILFNRLVSAGKLPQ